MLAVACLALALAWLYHAVLAFFGVPTLPDVREPASEVEVSTAKGFAQEPETSIPDLTVVVPACNEGESIQATLRSLLGSKGGRLQIVAINDRSTDATGALMDEVAAEAARDRGGNSLEVIHNHELPAGWLGKTHALALGAAKAEAPWLLFTDGDVLFDPVAARLALEFAQTVSADHVVLLLTLDFENSMEAAVFATFQALASWGSRLWRCANPSARDFFGAGGFNLVRRAVYEELGGFEALRMEVVEDLRLGWKIKRAGFSQRVAVGPDLVRIRWIQGALGIVRLLEKNGFAAVRYRTVVAILASIGFSMQVLLPLAAMACGGWATVAGLLVYGCIALDFAVNRRVTQVSAWHAVLFAPATALLTFALLRSTFLAIRRGGVQWRGTLYPLEDLRRDAGRW
jgi:glycosyltransferase involved in cell wall biosynthesis